MLHVFFRLGTFINGFSNAILDEHFPFEILKIYLKIAKLSVLKNHLLMNHIQNYSDVEHFLSNMILFLIAIKTASYQQKIRFQKQQIAKLFYSKKIFLFCHHLH